MRCNNLGYSELIVNIRENPLNHHDLIRKQHIFLEVKIVIEEQIKILWLGELNHRVGFVQNTFLTSNYPTHNFYFYWFRNGIDRDIVHEWFIGTEILREILRFECFDSFSKFFLGFFDSII